MSYGPAYGNRDSGALIVATRSDTNAPAVFSDFTALTTYTATTSGTTDAARISVTNIDFATEVFAVGTVSSNVVTAITAAYARVGTSWISVATNIVGTAGTDGTNGTNGLDGDTFDFTSVAERDTFFTAKPTALRDGLSINVTMGEETILAQVWQGGTKTSYTSSTDAKFWQDASIRSGTASFELGNVHTLSSGGENVFFTNENSDVNYFPAWQSVGDHRTSGGRTVTNRPTARVYSDLTTATPNGLAQSTGAVDYDTSVTLSVNTAIFGVTFILAEDYTGLLDIRVNVASVGNVFRSTQSITGTAGDSIPVWFKHPIEGTSGTTATIQAIKADETMLQVRPGATNTAEPYRLQNIRTFTDSGLLYQSEYTPPKADWTETDSASLAFIENKPTITSRTDLEVRNLALSNITVTGSGTGTHNSTAGTYVVNVNPTAVRPVPSVSSLTLGLAKAVAVNGDLNGSTSISYEISNYSAITSIMLITSSGDDITLPTPTRDGTQSSNVTLANIVTSSTGNLTFHIRIQYSDGTNTVNATSNTITVPIETPNYFYWAVNTGTDLTALSSTDFTRVEKLSTFTSVDIDTDIPNGSGLWILFGDLSTATSIVETITNENVLSDFAPVTSTTTVDDVVMSGYRITNLLSGVTANFRIKVNV